MFPTSEKTAAIRSRMNIMAPSVPIEITTRISEYSTSVWPSRLVRRMNAQRARSSSFVKTYPPSDLLKKKMRLRVTESRHPQTHRSAHLQRVADAREHRSDLVAQE